ncbi:MAG: hypothetical protein GY757_11075 [bacterium]|nr:hypothetical protein [bacterium]
MTKTNYIIIFSICLAAVVIAVILYHYFNEKQRKSELKKTLRKASPKYKESHENKRVLPRFDIPEGMVVTLSLTDDEYFGLKAHAIDVSLSGFSVKPDFPLKKLPIDGVVNNVLVDTAINSFAIRVVRSVRIEHQVAKRLLAFHIESIDEDQLVGLKNFMVYLEEFYKDNVNNEE